MVGMTATWTLWARKEPKTTSATVATHPKTSPAAVLNWRGSHDVMPKGLASEPGTDVTPAPVSTMKVTGWPLMLPGVS